MTDATTPSNGATGGAMPALSDDILFGARAVALFIYGDDSPKNQRRIYHAGAKLGMPTFQMGSTICARRSTLLKWIEKQEAA